MNRLADETSPYLLQHADNPVAWWPWTDEALAVARADERPILLSVGYSACHWCHVMAHESFEDPEIARLMNEHFVCIKVDREERPDIDALYMDAVVALTGQGGWPMTVFLTPEGRPFYGGTYYPPEPRQGMPSLPMVLEAVAAAWRDRRSEIEQQGAHLAEALGRSAALAADEGEHLDPNLPGRAVDALSRQHDPRNGGFGRAPKFPPSSLLPTLLAIGGPTAEAMAARTLRRMAAGGIHDQLGGGFHRYAVDAIWLVPHFEKMLYDNALLAEAYADGATALGDEELGAVARGALGYLDRRLTVSEGGGLASAEDADTEGVEGSTFVWTPQEIADALASDAGAGDGSAGDAELAIARYGVTAAGNFEGRNVLWLARDVVDLAAERGEEPSRTAAGLAGIRERLLAARDRRPQPSRDGKALAAWNGLALRAFARAGRRLHDPALVRRGVELARFLEEHLRAPDGGLLRTYADGRGKIAGFSDDYGAVADGLIELALATGDLAHLERARELTALALDRFGDPAGGPFYLAPTGAEELVARTKSIDDNPLPSGTSLLAHCLAVLGRIYAEPDWEEAARSAVRALAPTVERAPQAFGRLLGVVRLLTEAPVEVAIVGDPEDERTLALRAVLDDSVAAPAIALVAEPSDPLFASVPLLAGRTTLPGGAPAAYVCERFACQRPVGRPEELWALLAPPPPVDEESLRGIREATP